MSRGVKTAIIIGSIIVGLAIIVPLIIGLVSGWGYYGSWRMMGPGMMGGYGFMWFTPILWIVILGLIIWAIVAAVGRPGESRSQGSAKTDSALEILKQRYARGEIGKEEYEQKRKDLT
jgi:putative membrane protein